MIPAAAKRHLMGLFNDSDAKPYPSRELGRLAPTLENHCLLGEHLLAQGQAEEARLLLERLQMERHLAQVSS